MSDYPTSFDEIFDTPQKRRDALTAFQELKANAGFELYLSMYNVFIAVLDNQLKTEEFVTIQDQQKVLFKRQAFMKARDLLDVAIADLTPKPQSQQSFDPYAPDPRNQALDNDANLT